jgi:hypothetical protein
MSYTLYAHPELPAIILEIGPEFDLKGEMEDVLQDLQKLLDQAGQPVYYINNITGAKLSFGDIVVGMGATASAGGVLRHPNLHELIMISASEIIKMGVKALGQAQYGGVKAHTANSLDDALAFVQSEIGKA